MKLIVNSNKLPENFDPDAIAEKHQSMLDLGHYLAVYIEDREGDKYEVRITLSSQDARAAYGARKRPIDFFIDQDVRKLVENFDANDKLGTLSARYESNGDPGAFGNDRHGGPSYGAYQFASRQGSVATFLNALKNSKPDFAQILIDAGGDAAARRGTSEFIAAWKQIAKDHRDLFFSIQHAFIKASHYDPFVRRVKQQLDLDVDARSMALKNVAWSVAVQHGSGNGIFRTALAGRDLTDDAKVIKMIYAERSNVAKHFRSSTKAVQNAVKARFAKELNDALKMLAEENT